MNSMEAHFGPWLDELIKDGANLPLARRPGGIEDFEWAPYFTWKTRVESVLVELLDSDSVYYNNFHALSSPVSGGISTFIRDTALGILKAVRADLSAGRLISFRSIVRAEIFADFLDMAQHLLDNGYKDASASLIGAVLERGLRDLARQNDVALRSRDALGSINSKLADAEVYNRLVQQNVQVWTTVRNHADHGEFNQYKLEDVTAMLSGVRDFLASH
jgi:hypothetical protein